MELSDTGLPVRILYALDHEGITTAEDVVDLIRDGGRKSLEYIRNIGPKAVETICDALENNLVAIPSDSEQHRPCLIAPQRIDARPFTVHVSRKGGHTRLIVGHYDLKEKMTEYLTIYLDKDTGKQITVVRGWS